MRPPGSVAKSWIRRPEAGPGGAPAPASSRLRTLLAKYPRMDVGDASLVMLSEMHPAAKIVTLDVRDFGIYRRFRTEALPLICPR